MSKRTNKGSWNEFLCSLAVGQRHYADTDLESYSRLMRTINTPKSRRPESMRDMEFKSSLFTAVSASNAADVRYLVCTERVV